MKFIQCTNCSQKIFLSTDVKVGDKISNAIMKCQSCGSDYDMTVKESTEGSGSAN